MKYEYQLSLFEEFQENITSLNEGAFCIKSFNDPSFAVKFDPTDCSMAQEEALEKLGYFLVTSKT